MLSSPLEWGANSWINTKANEFGCDPIQDRWAIINLLEPLTRQDSSGIGFIRGGSGWHLTPYRRRFLWRRREGRTGDMQTEMEHFLCILREVGTIAWPQVVVTKHFILISSVRRFVTPFLGSQISDLPTTCSKPQQWSNHSIFLSNMFIKQV